MIGRAESSNGWHDRSGGNEMRRRGLWLAVPAQAGFASHDRHEPWDTGPRWFIPILALRPSAARARRRSTPILR